MVEPALSPGTVQHRAADAAARGAAALAARQTDDHWPSDYSGPLFLLPGLVISYHITGADFGTARRARMLRYLTTVQRQDGGWGLHVEGPSTVLGTTLNYVALRLLGVDASDPRSVRARVRLRALGGAEGIPTWGKFWLAVLGLYRWQGVNPLLPELWLLPRRLPVHPANFWCHTRAVFLPMSYIAGHRWQAEESTLTHALRGEIFATPYHAIDWPTLRERIAPGDVYTPHSPWFKAFNRLVGIYDRHPLPALRRRALDWTRELIRAEDEATSYLDIGPVSKAIHLLAVWFDDPRGEDYRRHLERVDDYLWDGRNGTRMQGYNGSQFWDVAFAMQALLELRRTAPSPLVDRVLDAAHRFLDANQVRRNVPDHTRYYRDATAGSWPFSTAEQAWPVSDCTAEGLKVAVQMQDLVDAPLSPERLDAAVQVLLDSQNDDGGWSEYERSRGARWLEWFNAAEVFGDIMIGYSYTECTSACIQGLVAFSKRFPQRRAAAIREAIHRGAAFLRRRQRDDGSWYGGWGVCFTYGTWFGIEGLLAAGEPASGDRVQRAVRFLLEQQRADGAWGEAFESCVEHRYVQHAAGQVVQTAWAMLGLMAGQPPGDPAVDEAVARGGRFLMGKQRADGGWDREAIAGVFNRNCAINYDNYRFVFPTWALARLADRHEKTHVIQQPYPLSGKFVPPR